MSQADEIVASSRKVQAVITEILHNSSSSIETGRRMYEVRVLLSRCSSQASHEIYLYWDHWKSWMKMKMITGQKTESVYS